MSRAVVNELSECYATAEYLDDQKAPFVPASVRYKVDRVKASGAVVNVVPYTAVPAPGTQSKITITSTQNELNGGANRETRRVTFEVTPVGGTPHYPYVEYDIVRTFPS